MVVHASYIGPALGGVVAGVCHTLLGPDHISSIVTLSACQGVEAFWFGVRWAGGHLAGMAILGIVLTIAHSRLDSSILERYEHGADYLVGIMLIAFGMYFLFNSQEYFDAESKLKCTSCSCHNHFDGEWPSEHQPLVPSGKENPARSDSRWSLPGLDVRKNGSVLVGLVQGVACPGGLVGMAFLKQYTELEMICFFLVFFAVTILVMGSAAMLYGVITQKLISSATFALKVYHASCTSSIVLGSVWIILAATGKLEVLLKHHHGHEHPEHIWHQVPDDVSFHSVMSPLF